MFSAPAFRPEAKVGRPAKIWFREQTGWWMLTIGSEKVKLSKDKDEAQRRFHEIKATQHEMPESATSTVADVVESFLAWASTHTKPATYKQYSWYGQKLAEDCGRHAARDFKPIHVTRWIEKRRWQGAHEYNAKRYTFRFFSWAVQEGNPFEEPAGEHETPEADAPPTGDHRG